MKKLCIILCLLVSACNPPHVPTVGERNESDKYNNYVIMCKHPLGHVMRHIVSKASWANSFGSRSGVYSFRDVEGVYHENSMGCYTNDKIRVDKQGKAKQ